MTGRQQALGAYIAELFADGTLRKGRKAEWMAAVYEAIGNDLGFVVGAATKEVFARTIEGLAAKLRLR